MKIIFTASIKPNLFRMKLIENLGLNIQTIFNIWALSDIVINLKTVVKFNLYLNTISLLFPLILSY